MMKKSELLYIDREIQWTRRSTLRDSKYIFDKLYGSVKEIIYTGFGTTQYYSWHKIDLKRCRF